MNAPTKSIIDKISFYAYIGEYESENAVIKTIAQNGGYKKSGFYEICLEFARCALEKESYSEEERRDAIDFLHKEILSFHNRFDRIRKRDLFEIVQEIHGNMSTQLVFPSMEKMSVSTFPDLSTGGHIGNLCVGPVLDMETQDEIWGDLDKWD